MFGAYRLFLSMLVMNGHLFRPWYPAAYAVYSFFILSGYLMTFIMNNRYGYSLEGRKLYVINRFLRIYPPYYVAVVLSLLLVLFLPIEFIQKFNHKIVLPSSIYDVLKNIFIFGLDKEEPVRLVPLAWALHIELFYYVAIGLYAGKSKKIALVWLGLSLAYVAGLLFAGKYDFAVRYQIIPAASLPFSIGACLFHFKEQIARMIDKVPWVGVLLVSLMLYSMPFFIAEAFSGKGGVWLDSGMIPFYLNMLFSAFLVITLTNIPRHKNVLFKKIDAFLGSLSYPVYLFHFQAAILAGYIFNLHGKSFYLLIFGGTLTILFALVEAKFLSNNIERLRDKNKASLSRH